MSSRKGLPGHQKMRHDRHFVEALANHSVTGVGLMLRTEDIETNPEQPRSNLGDLQDLAESIRRRGVLEPLLVRRAAEGSSRYQLIAGERRFHAALEAGLTEVPCVELTATDQEALELALVENLQRRDLSAFEEAEGYRTLVEKYGYTHEAVAGAVGKSRSTVTEGLKLLAMPPGIRDLCRHADITAKSVLLLIARAESVEAMETLVQEIAEGRLDREAARYTSQQLRHGEDGEAPDAGAGNAEGASDGAPGADAGRFRPIQIRYRPAADAPVHLSLSIRRPGITRAEVIDTLESLLARVRSGELDERLQPPSPAAGAGEGEQD